MTNQTSTRRNYKAEAKARAFRINAVLGVRGAGVRIETGLGAYLVVGVTDTLGIYAHRMYGDGSVSEYRDYIEYIDFSQIASIEEVCGLYR